MKSSRDPYAPACLRLRILYVAGPMTGKPNFNYPLFNRVAEEWRAKGYIVNNPAENFGGLQLLSRIDYMRRDLLQLLDSDFVVLLNGWEASEGAFHEYQTAKLARKPTVLHRELEFVPDDAELRQYLRVRHGDVPYWSGECCP